MHLYLFALLLQSPFTGRWDLTISTPNGAYPGWLEVASKGGQTEVRFQPRSGSVRPVKDFKLEGDKLTLSLSPQMTMELTAKGSELTGVQKRGDSPSGEVKGLRAPTLDRPSPKSWTPPQPLFNGKDLAGWEPDRPDRSHWIAQDGYLVNAEKGANLRTTRPFNDFKLHLEVNCPDRGNSGLYLRGRYEMQIEYEAAGVEDAYHSMGAIYGMAPVTKELPRRPGEWESFDVTLVGRRVTIVRNGVTIIDNQEVAGITGGALDSREGEPGPFYIQGDHTGGIKFRNMTISVPRN